MDTQETDRGIFLTTEQGFDDFYIQKIPWPWISQRYPAPSHFQYTFNLFSTFRFSTLELPISGDHYYGRPYITINTSHPLL